MATKTKDVTKEAKVVEKVAEPEVNPAIDPNKSAEDRLAALTEQQAQMNQDQAANPDYPIKEKT